MLCNCNNIRTIVKRVCGHCRLGLRRPRRCHYYYRSRQSSVAMVPSNLDGANFVVAAFVVAIPARDVILDLFESFSVLPHQYHDTTAIEFVCDTNAHPTRTHCRAMTQSSPSDTDAVRVDDDREPWPPPPLFPVMRRVVE